MSSTHREHVPIRTVAQLRLVEPRIPSGPLERELVAKHKPLIATALHDLKRGLETLAKELEHAPFAVVFEPEHELVDGEPVVMGYRRLDHGPSLNAAITAYCTLELGEDDPVNKPVRCHGVVGVREQRVIDLALEVNRLKGVVKEAFQPLAPHRITVTKKERGQDVVTKIPAGLFILRQLEQSSLNRLGAYRNIPLIRTWGKDAHPPTPIAVRFTESWSRSVPKATVDELIAEARADGRNEKVQILERCGIAGNEYLYSPKKAYPRIRANLSFPGASAKAKQAKNYMGEMPILFLMNRKLANPTVTPPKARGSTSPRQRQSIPLCKDPVIVNPNYYRRLNPADRKYA